MPRAKSFDVNTLQDVLLENESLLWDTIQNKYYGPSHDCWREISEIMNGNLRPKHIYTIVIENRYVITDKLKFVKPQNDFHSEEHSDEQSEISETMDHCSDSLADDDDDNMSTMKFCLSLSACTWKDLFCTKEYRDKSRMSGNYSVLRPFEWTNRIYDLFFEETRLSCCLSFERHKVTPFGAQKFFKFTGHCSNCKSQLTGIAYEEPTDDSPLIIHCVYVGNFKNCDTDKKRKLIGMKREEFSEKLLKENKSAAFIRREEASIKMNYGDPEPSSLPTCNTLCILKHRSSLDDLFLLY